MTSLEEARARIIALADAKPTTVFEKVAAEIYVDVEHHNGGIRRRVSLFEVLKYPNAFCVTEDLRVLNEPAHAPTWENGQFLLGPFYPWE